MSAHNVGLANDYSYTVVVAQHKPKAKRDVKISDVVTAIAKSNAARITSIFSFWVFALLTVTAPWSGSILQFVITGLLILSIVWMFNTHYDRWFDDSDEVEFD